MGFVWWNSASDVGGDGVLSYWMCASVCGRGDDIYVYISYFVCGGGEGEQPSRTFFSSLAPF
jgi:hypothetical protein